MYREEAGGGEKKEKKRENGKQLVYKEHNYENNTIATTNHDEYQNSRKFISEISISSFDMSGEKSTNDRG